MKKRLIPDSLVKMSKFSSQNHNQSIINKDSLMTPVNPLVKGLSIKVNSNASLNANGALTKDVCKRSGGDNNFN